MLILFFFVFFCCCCCCCCWRRWKLLTDEERNKYVELSAQDKIRHQTEMEVWNSRPGAAKQART